MLRDLMIIVLRALYDSQRETHGFQILRSGTLTTALMTGVASAQANTGNKLSVPHAISEFRAESEIA